MRKYIYIWALALLLAVGCKEEQYVTPSLIKAEVGKTLPDWSEGHLDIHLINTGRGEC